MHLDTPAFKTPHMHLLDTTSSPTIYSGTHKYSSSPGETFQYFTEKFSTAMCSFDSFNSAIHHEAENGNLFNLENENFVKQNIKKDLALNFFEAEDSAESKPKIMSHQEDEGDKRKLENFQDVFFIQPPFQPFSSPPSSVLSSLPALSPDDDIPNFTGLFSSKSCNLESEFIELSNDLQDYKPFPANNDYLMNETVRNGNIFMPIHNPPVLPNLANNQTIESEERNHQLPPALPEGFNTNVYHIPDHNQEDVFHNFLTQINDQNTLTPLSETYSNEKTLNIPKCTRSAFPKNGYTEVNYYDHVQPIPQKMEEFLPVLNFKSEYPSDGEYAKNSHRILDSAVKVIQPSSNVDNESCYQFENGHITCRTSADDKIDLAKFRTFGSLSSSQDLKERLMKRGRRKVDWKGRFESDESLPVQQETDAENPAVNGRISKRGAKTAAPSR